MNVSVKYLTIFICLVAFLKAQLAHAQSPEKEKIEREFRIDASAVPRKAREFISQFKAKGKIKWFQEVSEEGNSVEAKFKSKGSRFSIEFTSAGILEDMEIVLGLSDIPESIRIKIQTYLKQQYTYHKVEKIQSQYQESEKRLLKWRMAKKEQRTLEPMYELVVKTRNSGKGSRRYELLFDEEGTFVKSAKVTVRSDNILRF